MSSDDAYQSGMRTVVMMLEYPTRHCFWNNSFTTSFGHQKEHVI